MFPIYVYAIIPIISILLLIYFLPRSYGFFATLLEIIFTSLAVAALLFAAAAVIKTNPKVNKFFCSAPVNESLNIIFSKNSCKNPITSLVSKLNYIDIIDDITDLDVYDDYFKKPIDDSIPFIKKINARIQSYVEPKYIPFILITCGFLIIFSFSRFKFFVLLHVAVTLYSFVVVALYAKSTGDALLTKPVLIEAAFMLALYLVAFNVIILVVNILVTVLSVWPLFVSAAIAAFKFSIIFPMLPWYVSFIVLCLCVRWVFVEVSSLFILSATYLIWQGLEMIPNLNIRLEWYIVIFAFASFYLSMEEQFIMQKEINRRRMKNLKVSDQKKNN